MECVRIEFEVTACVYEIGQGLEDGFESWADVVIHGWVNTDSLVKIKRENGTIVCPYINTRRGRLFIEEKDYVITEADGSRHLCSKDTFVKRFQPKSNLS